MPELSSEPQALLDHVLAVARRHGATAADAMFVSGTSTEIRVRLGETEQVKQSREKGVGLRVFVGDRSATTSSSDFDGARLDDLVARTVEAARVIAEDPFSGLPDRAEYDDAPREDLDLFDEALAGFGVDDAIERAREAEQVARDADPRITNSEGAEMAWGTSEVHLANTHGVYRFRRSGSASLWTTPVAQQDGAMERDYWYTSARHLAALAAPAEVGREAARRTLRRLGARKPATCQVPVIFEAPVASRLLGSLAGALVGSAIYRKASWLVGRLGEPIAAPSVTIVDDPHVRRGPSSRAYDGEGLATRPLTVVKDGVLESYLLDTYTARKLGLTSTRHAARGLGGNPSPSSSNFWMAPGERTLDELVADTPRGLLVTELFGFGVNNVTGDYSQGAAGLWIEDGAIAFPVHELTIASTLPEMWRTLDAIGSDRDEARGTSAPSFRIARMTVAGS